MSINFRSRSFRNFFTAILFFVASAAAKAQTFTTLDDFSDGNLTTNPVWTAGSGSWQVASGVLQVGGASGTYRITTPFTKVCNAWEFRFDLDGNGFNGQRMEYYFFMTNSSSNPSSANGYRVSYSIANTTADNTISLQRVSNGVATTLVSFSNISGDQNIRVTRENNLWKLFTVGAIPTLRGQATDATYSPQSSAYQGALISLPSSTFSYNHGFDNIRFAEFVPPALNAQYNSEESKSICNGAAYTLSANPVGGSNCWMSSANWEYAWYTGDGTGNTYWNGSTWSNAENYSTSYTSITNVAPSSTTIYKVKVRCSADAASGAGVDATGVTVTVADQPVAPALTKSPNTVSVCQNTSLSVATGGGSGGVEGTSTDQYRYSTDNGLNWTEWSTTIPVFNAVTGTNLIQSRRISSGAGCNTSSINEVSWTVNANTSNTTTVTATNSYVWSVNGQTYTNSGTYQFVNGCNTEILNLTINTVSVNADIYESYAIINFGADNVYYDLKATTGNADFNGAFLGTFNSAGTLRLNGAQNKIFKCTGFDITNGKLFYRIYKTGNTPGIFIEVNLPFASNDPGAGTGCQNQTWQQAGANINLLSGLCDGEYTLEVYTQADYTGNGGGTIYAKNGQSNYKATFTVSNNQLSGIFESYVVLNTGGGNTFYNLSNFNGLNLGSFCQNASLVIAGGENKTYKCPPNDVLNGKLFYKIYPGTTVSGEFSEINLPFKENFNGALCSGGQNQKWQSVANTTNILAGLAPGIYTIEVYTQADYNSNGICSGTHYFNSGGANYKATFTVLELKTYYLDNDGDGYGTTNTITACSKPSGYSLQDGDCDDNNAAINSGATEVCNGVDDNCDGQIDEGVRPEQPTLACYETATFNTQTCQWDVTGTQPERPATECWQTATFNTTTCQWDVTGTQPERPVTECWQTATFNITTCQWNVTGTQPERPATECWQTAMFNTTTCQWDVTGTQPERPVTECWQTATFNTQTCQWDVTGTQPERPVTECWQTATFNTTTCQWDVTGAQPERPVTECWQTAMFNTTTCQWDVTGTQPERQVTECWQTATFNTQTCQWDVTGTQPERPVTECWQTATFNTTTCQWDVTGIQPERPVTECWQTAMFNTTTCQWDVTGAQPERPVTECWQTAMFNTTTCQWDVTGTQPERPVTECWQTATFNTTTCQWDVTGIQPERPATECWQTATFNTTTCQWDVTGTQPERPAKVNCWDNYVFNTTECKWENTGSQPQAPTGLACYEEAVFNTDLCQWEIKEKDLDPPTIIAPANITTTTDADGSGNCTVSVSLGTPTIGNDCGVVSVTNNAPALFSAGTTLVTWTVTNRSGKSATATQTITVRDNEMPVISCPANITSATDAGGCTKTIAITPATATDNCGIPADGITGVRSDGQALNAPYPFGTTTIIWTAMDVNGNTSTCSQTITVNQIVTIHSISVSPVTQQYSDRVSFTATVTPSGCPVAGDVGGVVTFRIGTQVMGTAPVVAGVATLSNVALLEPMPSGTLPIGQMMPGLKTATASISGTDADYIVNGATTNFTITKENAVVDYTGQEFASTGSETASTATVRLSATVRDITAADPVSDPHAGVIRNARARFIIRTLNPTNLSLVSTSRTRWLNVSLLGTDTRVGSISLDTVFNIGSNNSIPYEIGVEVDSFYTSSTNSLASLVVSKTLNDFVTFGGNILMNPNTSAGLYPSNTGSRLNFGGQAKWNKNGNNLQGGVNIIWRTGTKVYQVKGILGGSNGSLSVSVSNPSVRRATINAKANITDTETGLAVPNTNASTVTINLRDRGEPGTLDSIAIEVRNGAGQLVYSSNWTGIRTSERMLSGGNVQIRGSIVSTPATRKADEETITSVQGNNLQRFELKVFTNPTSHSFGLQSLSSDKATRMILRITDVNGRIIAIYDQLKDGQNLKIGDAYDKGVYFAELIQGDQRKVIRLLKIK